MSYYLNKFLKHIAILYSFIMAIVLSGCGYYSFSGASLPGINKIYVPIFGNSTTEFGLEQQLTDAVVAAVNSDSKLNIADRKNADAILEGRITAFNDGLYTFNADETVTEYSVRITVKVKFEDVKNKKTILDESFSTTQQYASSSPALRDDAIKEALKKISNDIINKAFSGW